MGPSPQRKPTRARHIDYAAAGAYFVTIVCGGRAPCFGEVIDDGTMALSGEGRLVDAAWRSLPCEFPRVALDAFVVMPNHVHGIVLLRDEINVESVGAGLAPPDGEHCRCLVVSPVVGDAHLARVGANPSSGGASPAPTAVDAPSHATVDARAPRTAARCSLHDVVRVFKSRSARAIGRPTWQRSFHDHVIRDEDDLARVRRYISENPLAWALDPENPARRVSA